MAIVRRGMRLLARLLAPGLPLAPAGLSCAAVAWAIYHLHLRHWGFDLLSGQAWSEVRASFLSGRYIVASLDQTLRWLSLPAALGTAAGAAWVSSVLWIRICRTARRLFADRTPIDGDYDPAVLSRPIPGGKSRVAPLDLGLQKALRIDDASLTSQTRDLVDEMKNRSRQAVEALYGDPAPDRDRDASQRQDVPVGPPEGVEAWNGAPQTDGDRKPSGPEPSIGRRMDTASETQPAPPPIPILYHEFAIPETTRLRLFARLNALGWSEAVWFDVPVATTLRSTDRVDAILAGHSLIYAITVVSLPPSYIATPCEGDGYWAVDGPDGPHSSCRLVSPAVRALYLQRALDHHLDESMPQIQPVVLLADGYLRGDTEHQNLWDERQIAVLWEYPADAGGMRQSRTLATMLSTDEASRNILAKVKEMVDARVP